MQLIAATVLFLVSLVLAQGGPPIGAYTISNPATGLFVDFADPGANFVSQIVGNDPNGQKTQVWWLMAGQLRSTKPSVTPLGLYASGIHQGEILSAFFKDWSTFNITDVGEGLYTLGIGDQGFVVSVGKPGSFLTLESPVEDEDLQKWLFTASPTSLVE